MRQIKYRRNHLTLVATTGAMALFTFTCHRHAQEPAPSRPSNPASLTTPISYCTEAHAMSSRAKEAISILRPYVEARAPIPIWGLMSLMKLAPNSDTDAALLGRRTPFLFAAEEAGSPSKLVSVGTECSAAPPGCSEGTFPVFFAGKIGSAVVAFPKKMEATLSTAPYLQVKFAEPVDATISEISALPKRIRLHEIELDQSSLRYLIDIKSGITWIPARITLRLEGTCASI